MGHGNLPFVIWTLTIWHHDFSAKKKKKEKYE